MDCKNIYVDGVARALRTCCTRVPKLQSITFLDKFSRSLGSDRRRNIVVSVFYEIEARKCRGHMSTLDTVI